MLYSSYTIYILPFLNFLLRNRTTRIKRKLLGPEEVPALPLTQNADTGDSLHKRYIIIIFDIKQSNRVFSWNCLSVIVQFYLNAALLQ